MSTNVIEPVAAPSGLAKPKKKINFERGAHTAEQIGLGYFAPYIRMMSGEKTAVHGKAIFANTALPLMAFLGFLVFWVFCSRVVVTDSWRIPSPAETWTAALGIHQFSVTEAGKREAFRGRMEKLAGLWDQKAAVAKTSGQPDKAISYKQKAAGYRSTPYAGPPTYYQQIGISLLTVSIGFLFAALIAIPTGILCGLSRNFNTAVNPLIQIFKPVSPLAWLPIVFVFVTVIYNPSDAAKGMGFGREIFISAGTVTLCSLWPTLINTAVGVASIDKDHMNVAKVLNLSSWQRLWKIVLPSSLPLMFTGLRLSLGVGWMVLIAADMLAQNPGLGKFVWDTFQNGSTESMAQILVAVFTIGIIGFFLDRIMFTLQSMMSFGDELPA